MSTRTARVRTIPLTRAAAAGLALAAAALAGWIVAHAANAPAAVSAPLGRAWMGLATLAAVAGLLVLHAQALDRRLTAARCAVRQALRDELAPLAEQVRTVETATAGALEHVAGELHALREALPALLARVEELERRADDLATVVRIFAETGRGNGQVRVLPRQTGPGAGPAGT